MLPGTSSLYIVIPKTFLQIVFLLLIVASGSNAQLLDYGTYSGFGLGRGILGNDFAHPKAACITGTTSNYVASHAGVSVSIVYTESDYKNAFHIDQKAEASFLGIGGGGDELHFGQENVASSSAFDIVLEAYGEEDSNAINNVKWDDQYRSLLSKGTPADVQQVRNSCGDRYIETVFNESRLFLVLQVSKTQTSALTQFSGKVNGNIGLDVLTASASLGGDSNVSSANSAGAISMNVYSEGIGGLIPTTAAIGIATSDGLSAIAQKLSAYLTSLRPVGQPVKYQLATLPGLPAGDLSNDRIFSYLQKMKSDYAANKSRITNLDSELKSADPRRVVLREPQADADINSQLSALNTYANAVALAHDSCAKSLSLDSCHEQAGTVATPPPKSAVELDPIAQPTLNQFSFIIDNGITLTQNQLELIRTTNSTSLLDFARSQVPNASSIDLVAGISNGSYLSAIKLNGQVLPTPIQGNPVILSAQDLEPDLVNGTYKGTEAVPILHADALNPCRFQLAVDSGAMKVLDAICYTVPGQALKALALSEAAQLVSMNPNPITRPMGGAAAISGCFGPDTPINFPWQFRLSKDATTGDLTATVDIFQYFVEAPSLGVGPPVFGPAYFIEEQESNDLQTWNEIAHRALISPQAPLGGVNPCTPHIP